MDQNEFENKKEDLVNQVKNVLLRLNKLDEQYELTDDYNKLINEVEYPFPIYQPENWKNSPPERPYSQEGKSSQDGIDRKEGQT